MGGSLKWFFDLIDTFYELPERIWAKRELKAKMDYIRACEEKGISPRDGMEAFLDQLELQRWPPCLRKFKEKKK